MELLRLTFSAQNLGLVNTHAVSNVSSHCHAEPHRCLTGEVKAANLYCDIQQQKNIFVISFPNLSLSRAGKWCT